MTSATEVPRVEPLATKHQSRALAHLLGNPSAVFGAALVMFFVIVALLAPVLPIPGPAETDWAAVRKAPSSAHWLGTDEIGRDVLSRMIWGAQASLLAGVVSVAIALGLGIPLGVMAGYRRG